MQANTYILLSEKEWHKALFANLSNRKNERWILIDSVSNFSKSHLDAIVPTKIFIPHWSAIIPKEIFSCYECILFHMTDLPFGRGGSPLQNLIVRGFEETKMSAIKVQEGIDTGPIYLKKNLALEGSAVEIFERSVPLIEEMIIEIIERNPVPTEQQGEAETFKRRKPEDGNLAQLSSLKEVYDVIRMLDCEGYPPAFIETPHFKIEFSQADHSTPTNLKAHVSIIKK